MSENASNKKSLSPGIYIIISLVSLIVAIGIGYYYLQHLHKSGTEKLDDRIFYLVLVLFGIAASALIFGVMNSYASLKGIQSNVTYKFTGPVVGVILTVLGGFMIPKGSDERILSIRVMNEEKDPITNGKVTLSFPHYQRESSINDKGMVVFPEIPFDQLRNNIVINITSDGFANITIDTLLTNFDPINITLVQSKVMQVAGTIKDAADRPIKDVEIMIDGTPYAATSINDGSFHIPIKDYHFGDRITLITSHPAYEDKAKEIVIKSGETDHIEFVLNPVTVNKAKPHKK